MKLGIWLRIEQVAWGLQCIGLKWLSLRVYDWLAAHAD